MQGTCARRYVRVVSPCPAVWLSSSERHQAVGPPVQASGPLRVGAPVERGQSVETLHRAFRRLDHVSDHAAFEWVSGQWFAQQGLELDEALALDGKTLPVHLRRGDALDVGGGGAEFRRSVDPPSTAGVVGSCPATTTLRCVGS